jgi:hypothetical protein
MHGSSYDAHTKSHSAVALFPSLYSFGVVNNYSALENIVHFLLLYFLGSPCRNSARFARPVNALLNRNQKAFFRLVLVRECHTFLDRTLYATVPLWFRFCAFSTFNADIFRSFVFNKYNKQHENKTQQGVTSRISCCVVF